MCGIVGFASPNLQFSESDLKAMTDAISHRGPDADGFFRSADKTVGLGHRRLSIIDLSTAANQPMYSSDGRYVIVFNGEIYNYKDIEKKLGIQPKTTSDTEIILEAFARLGPDGVQMFNGMFAFAIYDIAKNKLYLFRDRLGVKPLYYFQHENNFAFCSEIKGLLRSQFIKERVSIFKPAINNFLHSGYIPGPYTIYREIKKLPSGCFAVINNGDVEITSYWKAEEKISAGVQSDFGSAKKQLDELLQSSVQYRMISDVPMGTFLSGGIDSSIVTAMAQKLSSSPINTFSIGFNDSKFDESKYARQVSKHLGTNHHEFTVTEDDALELIDRMMTAYDEPYADSSAIPTMLVSKLARPFVTVTLSGDGGDELFMGYGAYNWAKRLDNSFVHILRKPIRFSLSNFPNKYKRAAEIFNYPNKTRIKSHIFSQEQYLFSQEELKCLVQPEYKSECLFSEDFPTLNRSLSAAEQQALFDIKYYLKDDLLVKVDIASMQFSLETRTPFLDYRIVEFALNLDERLKRKGNIAKYLLKEVLYDYVPRKLFERPKWGFSIPLSKWLKTDLNYLITTYLREDLVRRLGIVNPVKTAELVKRFLEGDDYLYNRLWLLILIHKWMEDHGH